MNINRVTWRVLVYEGDGMYWCIDDVQRYHYVFFIIILRDVPLYSLARVVATHRRCTKMIRVSLP